MRDDGSFAMFAVVFLGVIIAASAYLLRAPQYEAVPSGPNIFVVDRYSGEVWLDGVVLHTHGGATAARRNEAIREEIERIMPGD